VISNREDGPARGNSDHVDYDAQRGRAVTIAESEGSASKGRALVRPTACESGDVPSAWCAAYVALSSTGHRFAAVNRTTAIILPDVPRGSRLSSHAAVEGVRVWVGVNHADRPANALKRRDRRDKSTLLMKLTSSRPRLLPD